MSSQGQQKPKTLRRLLGYITRQKLRLAVALALLVVGSVVMSFQPLVFGTAVNELTNGDSSNSGTYAAIIIGLALGAGTFTYLANRQLAMLAQRAMSDLRSELFDRMQDLSLNFYDSESSGDLEARITSDVEAVSQFFSAAISRIVAASMTVITMLIIMSTLDLLMMGVVLLVVPASAAVVVVLGRQVQEDMTAFQSQIGELNGYVEESITGQKIVMAFARGEASAAVVRTRSDAARLVDRRSQFMSYLFQPANRLLSNLDVALVALIGGGRALSGAISVGDVVSFMGYAQQFGGQTMQLSQVVPQIMQAIAGGNRVFEVIDSEPQIIEVASAAAMSSADGKVDFNHVDFRYSSEKQILFDNDFHVQPGEMVGIVGPTGAGKSTIINLLTRFYDIESGAILVDDVDIARVKLDDLRDRCGVVLQVPYLFTETVMYNLKYGRRGATEDECIEAAKRANAHDFIQRLPDGYDTILAAGGENLSQGQRQLLTIARAIVADSDVLVLDEATSSVDTRTERRIQSALDELLASRTSFVIAHRLSTIRHADQIIALEGGHIREIGSHDELMDLRGFYYDLYLQQFHRGLSDTVSAIEAS